VSESSKLAFGFLVLTAARSGEVREAAPERGSRFTPSTSPGEAAALGMMMA